MSLTAATTSLTVYDDFTLTAEFLAPTLTVAAALDNSWVYQNTASTTLDRQCRTMTISVPQDSWPDQTYTVTVTQDGSGVVVPSQTYVDSTGSGAVTQIGTTTGTLTLSGTASDYSGGTTVNSGTPPMRISAGSG